MLAVGQRVDGEMLTMRDEEGAILVEFDVQCLLLYEDKSITVLPVEVKMRCHALECGGGAFRGVSTADEKMSRATSISSAENISELFKSSTASTLCLHVQNCVQTTSFTCFNDL